MLTSDIISYITIGVLAIITILIIFNMIEFKEYYMFLFFVPLFCIHNDTLYNKNSIDGLFYVLFLIVITYVASISVIKMIKIMLNLSYKRFCRIRREQGLDTIENPNTDIFPYS